MISLYGIGLVADDNRPEMMYNKTGTYVAMTQILLPFMVLPLVQCDENNFSKLNESWKIFRWNTNCMHFGKFIFL